MRNEVSHQTVSSLKWGCWGATTTASLCSGWSPPACPALPPSPPSVSDCARRCPRAAWLETAAPPPSVTARTSRRTGRLTVVRDSSTARSTEAVWTSMASSVTARCSTAVSRSRRRQHQRPPSPRRPPPWWRTARPALRCAWLRSRGRWLETAAPPPSVSAPLLEVTLLPVMPGSPSVPSTRLV